MGATISASGYCLSRRAIRFVDQPRGPTKDRNIVIALFRSMPLFCLASLLLIHVHRVGAQPLAALPSAKATTATTAAPPTSAGLLRKTGPPIYHVEDGEQLLPLVGFTLDEFQQLFDIQQGLAQRDAPPEYVLLALTMTATVDDGLVRVTARLKVRSYVKGIHRLPLGAGEAQLGELDVVAGEATIAAQFNESWNGYELLLAAEADRDYELAFDLLARVRSLGSESRLTLSLPRTMSSTLEIALPGQDLLVDVGDSVFLTSRRSEAGQTKLVLTGLTPDLLISWQPRQREIPSEANRFDVQSRIDVEVDGRGLVTSRVEMDLRSYDNPLERFVLRVPSAARLAARGPGYSLNPRPEQAGDYREFDVFLSEPQRQPSLRLLVEFDKQEDNAYQLASYDVVGALEQAGTLHLFSTGNWQLSCTTDRYAQRISPADRSPRPIASFDFGRPNQIRLALAEQQSQLTVAPTYELKVRESEVMLRSAFQYGVRGANARSLKFNLGSWEQVVIGPPQRVAWTEDQRANLTATTAAGPNVLEVPLLTNSSDFLITLEAVQPLKAPLSRSPAEFALELPTPVLGQYDRQQQSMIVITSAASVVVDGQEAKNPELAVASLPDELVRQFDDEPVTPLCYQTRERAMPPRLQLAARALEQTQQVSCESEIEQISDELISIRQTMHWKIENVQLTRATLMVPDEIYSRRDLRVSVNGLEVAYVPGLITFAEASGNTPILVSIPAPGVGTFEITLAYGVPRPAETDPVKVPLVVPMRQPTLSFEGRFLNARVAGYRVDLPQQEQLDQTDWTSVADDVGAESLSDTVLATTNELANEIVLSVQRLELSEGSDSGITIDRAWFQSWLDQSRRRDRAVFRVRASTPRIQINVPSHLDGKTLYVLVNGVQQNTTTVQNNSVVLDVDQQQQTQVIDIVYPVVQRNSLGSISLNPPRIENATIVGQWFWHVVVPRSECLLQAPRYLTTEDSLGWFGWLGNGQKDFAQTALEDWSTVPRSQPRMLQGSREYLFTALGEVTEPRIRTASLAQCLILTGGTCFAVGLLLMYTQRRQRTVLLCLVSLALACVIWFNPAFAALAGQAAVVGFTLVTFAALLRWVLDRAAIGRRPKDALPDTSVVERAIFQANAGSLDSSAISPGALGSEYGSLVER